MVNRLIWAGIAAVLLVSLAGDFLVPKGGEAPWWLHRGFFAWFGFVGCAAIVLIAKWLGRWWLQRPEDYYDAEPGDE